MYKKKPFFIVFEGVEGCGKSFQSKKLFNNLKKKKIISLLTREPGGTKSAELIRNLILKDYFNKGDKVQITDGVFENCIAIFQSVKSEERVLILLNLLGQEQNVNIDKKSLVRL